MTKFTEPLYVASAGSTDGNIFEVSGDHLAIQAATTAAALGSAVPASGYSFIKMTLNSGTVYVPAYTSAF